MSNLSFKTLSLKIGVFLCLITAYSCSVPKQVIIEKRIEYEYRDSTRIKDSTVVIPIERIVDIVPDIDTLKLETSLARAKAWVESNTLKGEIENKEQVIYKYIEKEKIVRKDSLIYEPKPYPVEVQVKYIPKIYKWSLVFSIGFLIVFVVFLLKKLGILKI